MAFLPGDCTKHILSVKEYPLLSGWEGWEDPERFWSILMCNSLRVWVWVHWKAGLLSWNLDRTKCSGRSADPTGYGKALQRNSGHNDIWRDVARQLRIQRMQETQKICCLWQNAMVRDQMYNSHLLMYCISCKTLAQVHQIGHWHELAKCWIVLLHEYW